MASVNLPVPAHFSSDSAGRIYRVPYEQRAIEAREWARRHQLKPASADVLRIALLAIDVQNTFCVPGFELFVAGRSGYAAVDDSARLCEFLYRNLGRVSQVIATMDTHQAMQIFHAIHLVNEGMTLSLARKNSPRSERGCRYAPGVVMSRSNMAPPGKGLLHKSW